MPLRSSTSWFIRIKRQRSNVFVINEDVSWVVHSNGLLTIYLQSRYTNTCLKIPFHGLEHR